MPIHDRHVVPVTTSNQEELSMKIKTKIRSGSLPRGCG
jgi:hypothetical protein